MIVILNGYNINDGTSGVYLDVEITGLELPEIRTSSGSFAGRDGGWIGAQFYSPRQITLQGSVFASDVVSLGATRRAFQSALKGKTVTMQIFTDDGAAYVIYANLLSFKMPVKRNKFSAPFQILLFAGDPTIYDNATGTALTANLPKLTSGGYTYPVVYPVVYAAGSSPTAVANSGEVTVYPTITLTGSMTNPTVSNLTTGLSLGLTMTTAPGDVVVIDMRAKTVLLNGGNVYGLLTAGSSFWGLQSGSNSITLNTTSAGDSVSGLLSWRAGFLEL